MNESTRYGYVSSPKSEYSSKNGAPSVDEFAVCLNYLTDEAIKSGYFELARMIGVAALVADELRGNGSANRSAH